LQAWLGHKRIDETMLYVHVAESHAREWPEHVHAAAATQIDPESRCSAFVAKPRRRFRKLNSQPELSREGRRTRTRCEQAEMIKHLASLQ
jgi:hypothetical protein